MPYNHCIRVSLDLGCTLNRVDRLNSINAIFCFRHRKRGILIGKIMRIGCLAKRETTAQLT